MQYFLNQKDIPVGNKIDDFCMLKYWMEIKLAWI